MKETYKQQFVKTQTTDCLIKIGRVVRQLHKELETMNSLELMMLGHLINDVKRLSVDAEPIIAAELVMTETSLNEGELPPFEL